ncbi:MAG: heme ABC exporter ATP-binding protein CcmA [Kordiimonas sp.]
MQEYPENNLTDARLVAENLSCKRGGRLVFEGVSFSVGAGDFLHLKGANGSGKTTLIRLLAGFISARSGTLSYAGESIGSEDIPDTGAFIYSGHQHGLKPVLTLRKNMIAYYQLMTGCVLEESQLMEAAKAFGLQALIDHPVRFFSSGQTHRCSLLRFLLLDRPIWLMDEPTVGLDSANRELLCLMMKKHLKNGGIIIAASHDPVGIDGQTLEMANCVPKVQEEEVWL